VVYSGFVSAAIDPLIGGLAYHTAGQVKILKDNLSQLSEYAEIELSQRNCESTLKKKIKSQIIHRNLLQCIEHHNAILRYLIVTQLNFFQLLIILKFLDMLGNMKNVFPWLHLVNLWEALLLFVSVVYN
jgi:hypothetical protein